MMPYKVQFLAAIRPRACCWPQVVAILAVCLASSVIAAAADEQEITIGTLHAQMKYDMASFQVKPGNKVRLTLKNTDEMQHNLVILTPGENKVMEVAQKAWALGEEAVKKAFIADVPDVLFHTKVAVPQKSDTIALVAPETEADCPFVCLARACHLENTKCQDCPTSSPTERRCRMCGCPSNGCGR